MGTDLIDPAPQADAGRLTSRGVRRGGRDGERASAASLAAGIALAWTVSYLCHVVHLDLLLVPLVVLAFAAVLRTGAALVDRLMAAMPVTAGAVLTLGLATSLTPVRLATAPQAALLLTAAVAAAWWSGRRPRVPWRVRPTDALLLVLGAFAFYEIHKPTGGKAISLQLEYSVPVEDRITHFSIFDEIRRAGGYGFFHHFVAGYPQGMHYLMAWLDGYVGTFTHPADQLAEFSQYYLYIQVTYVALLVALVWAARWVAEPYLRGWRSAGLQVAVAAVAVLAPFPLMVADAFDAELFGLMLLALSIALLIRPAHSAVEHLVIGSAATIAVAFTYNAYVVFVAGAFVVTTFLYRARYRGRLLFLGLGYAVALGIAAFPSVYATLSAGMDYGAQALVTVGRVVPVDKSLVVALALLTLAGLGSPAARRIPRPWAAAGAAAGAALVLAVFGLWQHAKLGADSYYFSKFLNAVFVILLVTAPVAGFLATRGWWERVRRPGARTAVLGLGAPLLAAATFATALGWGIPGPDGRLTAGHSPLSRWARGANHDSSVMQVAELYRAHPHGFGPGPVVVMSSDDGYRNFRQTRFYMTLIGRNDDGVRAAGAILHADFGWPVTDEQQFDAGMSAIETVIRQSAVPPVFLIMDHAAADRVRARLAADRLEATVLWYPLW
jgi:hypothetical protein